MDLVSGALSAYEQRTIEVPRVKGSRAGSQGESIDKKSELYGQCQEFEAIFIKMMLKQMRQSVEKSGLIEETTGKAIFEDMLYDEYAKGMSKTANFGLADQVYLELVRSGAR